MQTPNNKVASPSRTIAYIPQFSLVGKQVFNFGQRQGIPGVIRDACHKAVRSLLRPGENSFDFGFGPDNPVCISNLDTADFKSGELCDIKEAIALIAYSDVEREALFLLFRSKKGELIALMGNSSTINNRVAWWMGPGGHGIFNLISAGSVVCAPGGGFPDIYSLPGFGVLLCDADGKYADATVEGSVVDLPREFDESDFCFRRLPIAVLAKIAQSNKTAARG